MSVTPDGRPRLGFFTDTSVCIGCKACEVACKEWNAIPADGALDRMRQAPIDEIVVTNSIPVPAEKRTGPITVLSVAPLLAEAIVRVHENRSVSELFR